MQSKAVSFEKGNVKDLREKLGELLVNEDKVNKCKESAQEFICNKYDWNRVVEQTLRVYKL